jgi:hypothetical protein
MSSLTISALYLAFIWGVIWALTIQCVPLAAYLANKRTWLTVVIGVGVDLAIGLMTTVDAPTPRAAWEYQFYVIALSSVGIIVRSIINEWREHQEDINAAQNS